MRICVYARIYTDMLAYMQICATCMLDPFRYGCTDCTTHQAKKQEAHFASNKCIMYAYIYIYIVFVFVSSHDATVNRSFPTHPPLRTPELIAMRIPRRPRGQDRPWNAKPNLPNKPSPTPPPLPHP